MNNKTLIIFLTISLLLNLYWGWYMYSYWYPKEVSIPNNDMVNNFCKQQGYDSGWLSSSSCNANQVQCHKKIFDMDKYVCVDWISD